MWFISILLGSLVWYKLANEENPKLRFNLWDAQYENINSKVQFLSTNKDGTTTVPPKIDPNSEIYKEYLVHVLNGWIEAVDEAQKGQIHVREPFHCFFLTTFIFILGRLEQLDVVQ